MLMLSSLSICSSVLVDRRRVTTASVGESDVQVTMCVSDGFSNTHHVALAGDVRPYCAGRCAKLIRGNVKHALPPAPDINKCSLLYQPLRPSPRTAM
jgi:hypothetical protein